MIKKGHNYSNTSYIDMGIPYAAGSLYSTVDDLYGTRHILISCFLLNQWITVYWLHMPC
jgi:hypothetical protein